MRIVRRVVAATGFALAALIVAPTAVAQDGGLRPVRVVMASSKLQVAPAVPLYFRLLQVSLPADRSTSFSGGAGFVFVSAGKVDIGAGNERQTLSEGETIFVDAGAALTVRARGPRDATWLHYLLVPRAGLDGNGYAAAAAVTELYRGDTAAPLLAGPHEFSLTRVTSPVGAPAPPMHHRSGAALYRVLAGSATVHLPDRDEARSAGAVQYEPNGFIHTWQNTGKTPLVLLQANISAEGAPEIVWLK